MTHVFVSPHPDDAALSCGGLIASLRELGQSVTIITVYSGGSPTGDGLTEYQRAALGFGTKAIWPATEAFNRGNIGADYPLDGTAPGPQPWQADPGRLDVTQDRANTQARQFWQRASWTRSANITNEETAARPLADSVGGQGTLELVDFEAPDPATIRRAEDERFVYFIEASLIDLGLPDAVFRGYQTDEALLGEPRSDDEAPEDLLRREILRLEPQAVYAPLGVGGHVDHQLCRNALLGILSDPPRWVMPGPDLADRVSFYEDFPYAWWTDFEGPTNGGWSELALPGGLGIEARYADISDQFERKVAGVRLYRSQIERLFQGDQGLLNDLAGYHLRVALAGGMTAGVAERYWSVVRP
jgi:LmbE family N-acetylglucosaminyl deacetylase